MEMSFVEEEDVMDISEKMIYTLVKDTLGVDLSLPFPRMSYDRAIERYGLDKPDTRFELFLEDITEIVKGSNFRLFAKAPLVKALKVPGGASLSRKEIDDYTEYVKNFGAQGLAWIKIKENEWQSPIVKFMSEEEKEKIAEKLGLKVGDIVFFQAASPEVVNDALGNLRVKLAQRFDLIDSDKMNFVWIVDFPLFQYNSDEKKVGGLSSSLYIS